jgi:hypothetical protein
MVLEGAERYVRNISIFDEQTFLPTPRDYRLIISLKLTISITSKYYF